MNRNAAAIAARKGPREIRGPIAAALRLHRPRPTNRTVSFCRVSDTSAAASKCSISACNISGVVWASVIGWIMFDLSIVTE